MADWGQNDEVVTSTKTAAPAKQSSSWGQDDEVVTKPVAKQEVKPTGMKDQFKAGGEAFVRSLPATGGFWAGSAAGATAVAPYAAAIAPAAPIVAGAVELLGGLAGGVVTAGGVEWATDKLSALMDPVGHAKWKQTQQQFPEATTAGSFAAGFAGSSWKTAPEVAGKLMSKPGVQRATSGALMGGFDATQQYLQTGTVDPKMVVASAAGGAALPGANVGGRVAQKIGVGAVEAFKPTTKTTKRGDIPPPPPETATPEEKAAYIDKLKTIKADRDAKAPLVEAAIRNKETGEIERMGPKHDPQRKAETIDTHDQGFIDERGNFHTREQAVDQAKRSGQIPEDHVLENPPGELPGLHSGDLRKVGDERFKVTEQQPPGEPKPPAEEPKAPVTRQEHKDAIDKLEEQAFMDLELQRQEAHNTGDTKAAAEIEAQQAKLEQQIADLRKSMPGVVFKNKALPTWEELHDHLDGARSVGEAFDRILKTDGLGTKGQRALLTVLNKSGFIRDADLLFNKDYLKYTDPKDGKEKNAAGMYTGGDQHLVQLAKEGDIRVLAHEAMHAGTQRLIDLGNSVAATKLKDLQEKFLAEHERRYQEALDQFKRDNIAATLGELKAFERANRQPYGFTNAHEFVAEAFTNKEFKQILASIKSTEPGTGVLSNMWQEFKNIVREGLNIPEGQRTAFDDAMEYGAALIEESRGFKREGDITPLPSKAPSSPDELATDRTKTDPRDVKDEKEFLEIATDIYEKHGDVEAVKFYEGYQQYKKTWLEPIKETEKFVGTNIKNKLANERLIHNETSKIMEKITDPARREAIAEAVDKGDTSGLSAEEKAVADQYSKLVKDIGDRAVEAGVVKGLLEDYVTHILDWAGAPKGAREEFLQSLLGTAPRDPAMRGMTTESKFGKERKFRTFADLEWFINEANARIAASGKSDFRLKIKTKDIAEIYKEYALSMEKAIENKKLVDSLKQVRNANGETLIREVNKDNPMPYGWEMMASPQFAGYAVHPDLMPALKFVFDAGPGDLMKAFGAISQLTKRLNVIGSFFHAKSLMEVMSSSKIPLWTPIKEAIVLPLVEKGVKAVSGKELQLSAISKAVEQFKNGGVGDNVDKWIKEGGLQLEMPEDVTQGLMSSMGKIADELIGKYGPKTRILEKSLSTVEKYTLGLFDKYTWDYLHTGGKIMVADAYLSKARLQAAKEGKPFDEVAARKEISAFVNDSFGGLNWFDAATQTQNEFAKRIAMAAYSPEGRRSLQLALFAPDWTLSTVRAFTAALPKGLNPTKWHPVEGIKGMMVPTTKADYARLYQFKTALTYLTLLNAINMMTANRPIWDNKDPTRIEWPDGTSMQAMKHAMEPYHWIMDPDKTLSNKLGFLPKAAVVGMAGVEYASPTAQKLVDPSAVGRLKAVGKMALPFQFQAGSNAPEGEAAKRAVLGTMGFPVYGSTPEQKKAARAEREKQLKEAARKYHEKAKEKGWEQ